MKTTFKKIQVADRFSTLAWDRLNEYYRPKNMDESITMKKVLAVLDEENTIAAMDTTKSYKKYLFMADVAELAHDVFSNCNPNDNRVKNCINAVRGFALGNSSWVRVLRYRSELSRIHNQSMYVHNAIKAAMCECPYDTCCQAMIALRTSDWKYLRPSLVRYCLV